MQKHFSCRSKLTPVRQLLSTESTPLFPAYLAELWVTFIGILAVVFALLYCHLDPSGVWWRLRVLIELSMMAGILALWLRSVFHILRPDYC